MLTIVITYHSSENELIEIDGICEITVTCVMTSYFTERERTEINISYGLMIIK